MDDEKKSPIAGTFAKLMSSGSPEKKHPEQASPPPEQSAEMHTHKQASKKESNMTNNIASNIAILPLFDIKDIEDLKEPAYMAQTYRLREADIEWVKDTAHTLSKAFKRRKVSQTDIVRISFKLFAKLLANNKADIQALLEQIK